MSSTTPDVAAALLTAASALPAHFEAGDELTIEELSAIQATTLSLPGGAIAVESVIKGSADIGAVILVIPGLVNHTTGEIFSRDDARTAWTAALTEVLTALGGEVAGMTPGQLHMTDAFDALDNADEATVVGVFKDTTLAAILMTMPATKTGQGAAAQLAAAVAAATAEAEGIDPDAESAEGADAASTDAASTDAAPTDAAPTDVVSTEAAEPAGGAAGGAAAGGAAGATEQAEAAAAAAMAAAAAAGGAGSPGGPIGLAGTPDAVSAAQAAAAAAAAAAAPMVSPVTLQPLYGDLALTVDPRRIDLLRDVLMGVSVELGRTRMTVQEILGLTPGSIVELDRAAGAPVDVLVNGKLIAHGEVVVVDEEFAVRISEVVGPDREGRVSA